MTTQFFIESVGYLNTSEFSVKCWGFDPTNQESITYIDHARGCRGSLNRLICRVDVDENSVVKEIFDMRDKVHETYHMHNKECDWLYVGQQLPENIVIFKSKSNYPAW